MKTKTFLFTLIVVTLCVSSCSDKKTWVEINELKGKIISYTDTAWYASEKFGEVCKEFIKDYTKVELNDDGQVTTLTKYDRDGSILEKKVWEWKDKYIVSSITTYYEDGDVSKKEIFTYNGDEVSTRTIFDYDDNSKEKLSYEYNDGKLSKITGTKNNKTKTITITYFDENDSSKDVEIDYDGTKTESISYYNSDGKLVKWIYDGDKYTYQYGANGLLEKSTYSDFVNTFDYKLDDKGNWIEQIEHEKWQNQKTTLKSYIVRSIEYKE